MTYPNLFVVGAMKAGTTTLYAWLRSHPDIYMSPVKEPNFFCSDLWDHSGHIQRGTPAVIERAMGSHAHNALVRDEALYLKLFALAGSVRFRGESSPSYLRSLAAPQRIRSVSPDARIIMVLRDPIERAWSHYVMERNEARVPDRFEAAMESELEQRRRGECVQHGILESGLYGAALERYRACFPDAQILVLDTAELRNPAKVFLRLAQFLGVENSFTAARDETNLSLAPRSPLLNRLLARSGLKQAIRSLVPRRALEAFKRNYYVAAPRSSELEASARERLRAFYAPDVRRLSASLGAQAPAWTEAYRLDKTGASPLKPGPAVA